MDKELDAKMWKDKTMTEAFTNHLTEIIICDQHSYLAKHLQCLKKLYVLY